MARITVVNDNPEFLDLMKDVLEDERHEATTIDGDGSDALDRIRASRPDVVVLDLRMGTEGMHGWDLANELRGHADFTDLPVLLCSADLPALKEIESRLEGQRSVEILAKPFGIQQLTDALDRLLAEAAGI